MTTKSKLSSTHLPSYLIGFIFIYLLSQRIPQVLDHFKAESSPSPPFNVLSLDGKIFSPLSPIGPKVLVFWATWCGPCEVELGRINKLIQDKNIPAEAVIAITSFEERVLVEKVQKERHYKFKIALDTDGKVADNFRVRGTPTVILIDEHGIIQWITTGVSPLLSQRIKNHFHLP